MCFIKIVGIDLAGKEENGTGFCVLTDYRASTRLLKSDHEILEGVKEAGPDLVAIDAPFEFPKSGMYREGEVVLKDMGFSPLSPNFPGMKVLVQRAKGLISKLKELEGDFEVIEVFTSASREIMGMEPAEGTDEDEFDSLICALTGRKYLNGEYKDLDGIIIPE